MNDTYTNKHVMALTDIYNQMIDTLQDKIDVVKQAIIDIDQLKLIQPGNNNHVPQSIIQSLTFFLQMHGKNLEGSRTLLHNVFFSKMDLIFQSDEERLQSLKLKQSEFVLLATKLYMSIYGLSSPLMYSFLLDAPEEDQSQVKYFVYVMQIYKDDTYSPYNELIFEILIFLDAIIESIYVDDPIDENGTLRTGSCTSKTAERLRDIEHYHPTFKNFVQWYIDPFVQTMETLKNIYRELWQRDPSTASEMYKSQYGAQHLAHIKTLLYDTALFLRKIKVAGPIVNGEPFFPRMNEKRKQLCLDIAFAIEVMIGLHKPLNELFKTATPLMSQYILQ